jgi:predicted AAA+ superfamily ATPase
MVHDELMIETYVSRVSFHRTVEVQVKSLSRSFPVVMVTGPRQVGKTTMLRRLADEEETGRRYVSLDECSSGATRKAERSI